MSANVFDNILCLPTPDMVSRWQVNKGSLEVGSDGITFQGKRPLRISSPVSVARVHSGAWANDLLRVDYAEGSGVSSVFFVVGKRGKQAKETTDRLEGMLQAAASPGRAPPEALERHRQVTEAAARAGNVGARTVFISGAVLLAVGLVVTGVSFAVAEPGATYVVAFGAIFAGILLMIRGMVKRTR